VVALIVTAATLVTSAIGLLGFVNTFAASVVALCGIALIAALYLCLPRLTRARSSAAADAPRSDLPERIGTHTASRWAVLGASGFIGSALIAELRARSFDVVAIPAPRLRLSSSATEAATLEQLANYQDVIDSLAETLTGIDVVVNAAGVAAPDSDADDTLFGANSLLPLVVLRAAERSRTARVVHLSSAAVQGRRKRLDESAETSPFSPYSRSKALGEAALLRYVENIADEQSPEAVIVRATSVQGAGRTTTQQLRRVARSRFAFVAGPGDRPTVVSSLQGLTEFVLFVGAHTQSVPTIVLQPWEGLTTGAVLEIAGGRAPRRLPASFCRVLVAGGYVVGAAIPAVNGLVRRVELMWLGQDQDAAWARSVGLDRQFYVADVLTTVQEAPK
jgi:dTDP-4-dehydrorhamnose reductase